MRARWAAIVAGAMLAQGTLVSAQEAEPGHTSSQPVDRVMATTDEAEVPPTFAFWESAEHAGFIKPVIQLSSSLVTYVPHSLVNEELSNRVSTLLVARFGLEGQIFQYVTFRSVFERNIGFTLSRNGPIGTSVWEGTASLQARENYIRIARWGLSLAGGIVPDPASLDFISDNVLDTLGVDPYIRDPLLVSGFNQSQGVLLNYTWRWLTAGFSFTGGNPLVTSMSLGFGGDVSSLGTLYSAPLRAFSNGIPGSDIQVNIMSPSLMLDTDVFDLRLAFQYYLVDIDITNTDDAELTGWNARATFQVTLLDDMLRFFGSAAWRKNQQLNVPDVTSTRNDYEGLTFGAGADVRWHDLGFGGNYYWVQARLNADAELTNQYVNVGLTYWLFDPNVSASFRFARSMAKSTVNEPVLEATDSFILGLRLLI